MNLFLIPLLSLFVSLVLKSIIDNNSKRRNIMKYGGMPSMHATFVSSICLIIALELGISSPLFAVTLTFSLIVISDSLALRRVIGAQSKILNREHQTQLPEEMGHRNHEVIAGILLGLLNTYVLNLFF